MRFIKSILVLLVASQANAFTLNSQSDSSMKGWDKEELVFKLNSANCPANVESLINDAMAIWNSVPSSKLKLTLGGTTSTTYAQLSGGTATDIPVIICDTSFSTHSGLGGNGVAGVAQTSAPPTGGHISYSYLLLNVEPSSTGNVTNFSDVSVSLVIAHEIGHVLGLGHSPDTAALMYFDASKKKTLSLGQDDIDGITYLYPRNEPSDKAMGCGLVAASAASGWWNGPRGGAPLILGFLMLPIAAAFALRKRRPLMAT